MSGLFYLDVGYWTYIDALEADGEGDSTLLPCTLFQVTLHRQERGGNLSSKTLMRVDADADAGPNCATYTLF